MSGQINYFLMALLCFLSFRQMTKQRLFIALAFSLSCVGHAIKSERLSDVLYYLSAGAIDLIIFMAICVFARVTRFTDFMLFVCGSSLLLNLYGLIIYENFYPPTSYNNAFSVLYVITGFIFLEKDEGDGDSGFYWFRLPYLRRYNFSNLLYKEAQGCQKGCNL